MPLGKRWFPTGHCRQDVSTAWTDNRTAEVGQGQRVLCVTVAIFTTRAVWVSSERKSTEELPLLSDCIQLERVTCATGAGNRATSPTIALNPGLGYGLGRRKGGDLGETAVQKHPDTKTRNGACERAGSGRTRFDAGVCIDAVP